MFKLHGKKIRPRRPQDLRAENEWSRLGVEELNQGQLLARQAWDTAELMHCKDVVNNPAAKKANRPDTWGRYYDETCAPLETLSAEVENEVAQRKVSGSEVKALAWGTPVGELNQEQLLARQAWETAELKYCKDVVKNPAAKEADTPETWAGYYAATCVPRESASAEVNREVERRGINGGGRVKNRRGTTGKKKTKKNKKNKKKKTMRRKAPKESAKMFKVGTVKTGLYGKKWKIVTHKRKGGNRVKKWQKV